MKNEKIKLLVLDVDGTLTDGGVYLTEKGDELKKFNTKDGLAIRFLTKQNFQVGIISASLSQQIILNRAKMLGVQHIYVGEKNKLQVLQEWMQKMQLNFSEIAYVGDDVNDFEVMQQVGLSACPSDAVDKIKSIAHYILERKGGDACVREFIDKYLAEIN